MRQIGSGAVLMFLMIWTVPTLEAQQRRVTGPLGEEERARAVLKRMTDLLSQAKSLSFTMDAGFDVVQDNGQKIEFGETRKVVLRRPRDLRVDVLRRDRSKRIVVFDGRELTVFDAKENVYAKDVKEGEPATVDEAIAHFVNDLDMRLPMAELLRSDLGETLPARVREAVYVEPSLMGGQLSDHIALRGDQVDVQLWVAQGERPVPLRAVITYTAEDGRPQFWAQLSDWDFAPQAADSLFTFTPPKGAVKINFSPTMIQQGGRAP